MNPSIRQLQAFVAVAQSQSLAEASERIHLSQPAISIALRKLEEAAGGALFARTTRQLTLTPEGKAFLPVAMRLLNDWTEAFSDLEEHFSKQRGKVTVAALPTLAAGMLPGTIAAFHNRYPLINLSLHDVLADEVNLLVREGRADLGLSVPPNESEDLAFEQIAVDSYVVACALGHPLLSYESVSWSLLSKHTFIGISRRSSLRQDIDRIMEEVHSNMHILCEVSQIATVGRMVAAGLGISVLPELAFRQINNGGLDYRPLYAPKVTRPLGIITRRRAPLSAAATALRNLLLDRNSP